MPRSNVVKKAIKYCKEQRHCDPYDLVIQLEISLSTLEKLWRLLKEMCSRGALDFEGYKCEYIPSAEAIEFREKGK